MHCSTPGTFRHVRVIVIEWRMKTQHMPVVRKRSSMRRLDLSHLFRREDLLPRVPVGRHRKKFFEKFKKMWRTCCKISINRYNYGR
jgi:hypothetical protein